MTKENKTCDNCKCPTMTTLNSVMCEGFRSQDGIIYKMEKCSTWKASADKWSVAEAIAYSHFVEIPVSRPTVIKICREKNAGRQFSGRGGRWIVYADKFKKILNGESE